MALEFEEVVDGVLWTYYDDVADCLFQIVAHSPANIEFFDVYTYYPGDYGLTYEDWFTSLRDAQDRVREMVEGE